MDSKYEHISQLVLEELTGIISDADKDFLEKAVAADPEAFRIRQEMHQVLSAPEVAAAQENLPQTLSDDKIMFVIHRKRRALIIRRISGVAAAVLVAAAGIFYLYKPISYSTTLADIPAGHISLEINGKLLDLTAAGQSLETEGIQLNMKDNRLSFSVSGTSATKAILRVPAGKDYKVALPDASEVWLNAGSNMEFPLAFNGNARRVRINGEAYVKVAANAAQPFTVQLPHSQVQVLGTEFNINTYDSGHVKVALLSGAVKVNTPGQSTLLKPGMEADYQHQSGVKTGTFDRNEVLSWQQGVYYFNDLPLEEVCRVITRFYGKVMVMDNPDAGNRKFTGFCDRTKPIDTFLENLKMTNGMDYYTDERQVIHIR